MPNWRLFEQAWGKWDPDRDPGLKLGAEAMRGLRRAPPPPRSEPEPPAPAVAAPVVDRKARIDALIERIERRDMSAIAELRRLLEE